MAKTTKKDFEFFKQEAQQWIERFGVKSYDITFTHEDDGDHLASCGADSGSRIAIINLSATDLGELDVTNASIQRAAFHEVLELLMWEITTLLRNFFSEDIVIKKTHEVIRAIENGVLE